ncbi:MAG TPA: HEAT repeat domain-containing protein [Longimicrobium sp.]|nr:HEAT repeat domain-containing protein [Longimicrobium sp.]
MPDAPDAAARFVLALAALVVRDGDASARAAEARAALDEVLTRQKSLVLDVQFTGFSQKGHLVGGVDPLVLRAAGHLITLRLNRVGFTPDAVAEDLEAFGRAVSPSSGELGQGGAIGALAAARPYGLYASTAAGDVYKPPPRTPPPAAEPAEEPAPAPAAASAEPAAPPADPAPSVGAPAAHAAGTPWEEVESTELAEFEFVDDLAAFGAPPAGEAGQAGAPSSLGRAGDTSAREEPPTSDMYHFFRTADTSGPRPEDLPRLLHEASTVTRFDELAESAARTALALLQSDAQEQAVQVLDALVREAERPDRTRFFRESALQALRRAGTADTLHRLLDRLAYPGPDRERILRFFVFLGADALLSLEGLLYRAPDPELRAAVFRTLVSVEGLADRLIAHAVQDPSPVRTRTLLELATQSGTNPEIARRWAGEAAAHRDAAVRVEAARTAAALGGRGVMRILVDLLNDPERLVRREAVTGLGALGDAGAVPFLARVLNDGDEELQIAAAAALGRLGTAEALPPLLGLVNKRSMLPLRKVSRPRMAALQAIARIDTPAAREAVAAISQGRDELAEEARRILATTG